MGKWLVVTDSDDGNRDFTIVNANNTRNAVLLVCKQVKLYEGQVFVASMAHVTHFRADPMEAVSLSVVKVK